MNKEMILDFSPSGSVTALHFDEFPLHFLGRMKVNRASEILFNEETQSWDVNIFGAEDDNLRSDVLTVEDFPRYDIARHFEVEFIQTCRKVRQFPLSKFCAFIAKSLRTEMIEGVHS